MRRREFSTGLIASAFATSATAGEDYASIKKKDRKPALDPFGRLTLTLAMLGLTVTMVQIVMMFSQSIFYYNTARKFRQSNDNRMNIPGLTTPTLAKQIKTAERIGDVFLDDDRLVVDVHTELEKAAHYLFVGDGKLAFSLGKIDRLKQDSPNKIPLLGNLPEVGALFRSRRNSDERNLIIYVGAEIVSSRDS
jgi:hypothetical protein